MMSRRTWLAALLAAAAAAMPRAAGSPAAPASGVEVLKPVAALPAHIAGSFQELTSCQQAADGDYFIFDRRSHSVYTASSGLESARKLIEIGTEPGRVLDPTAFDLAPDGTFVVADAPHGQPRVQRFLTSGSTLNGFFLPGRAVPRIVLRTLVLNGIGAIEYTGRSLFVSQPEGGALIAEYGLDGTPVRQFGELRRTGHEADRDLHLALNAGLVVSVPDGGVYFVFQAGVPVFRRYDAAGRLVFERHIEGPELDGFIQALPESWPRKKGSPGGELPLVLPSVLAAGLDAAGRLWVSMTAGVTYVHDADGMRQRAVQFRAAGTLSPTGLFFTRDRRVLVTPGCYAFPAR